MKREEANRVWGRMTVAQIEQMEEWASQVGMTFSQFVGICAWAGAKEVMKVLSHPANGESTKVKDELPKDSL